MYLMRKSWTDERLEDFRDEVNRRFDKVDHELNRVNDRLDGMHRTMTQALAAMLSTTLLGFLTLASLILTH